MRRTSSASASRLCTRVCAIPLTAGMLLVTPGLAVSEPGSPGSVGALVADVANVNQKLQDLGAAIQAKQESVSKAVHAGLRNSAHRRDAACDTGFGRFGAGQSGQHPGGERNC